MSMHFLLVKLLELQIQEIMINIMWTHIFYVLSETHFLFVKIWLFEKKKKKLEVTTYFYFIF